MTSEQVYTIPNNNLKPDEVILYSNRFELGDTVYLIPGQLVGATKFKSRIQPRRVIKIRKIKIEEPITCTGKAETNIQNRKLLIITTNIDNFFEDFQEL